MPSVHPPILARSLAALLACTLVLPAAAATRPHPKPSPAGHRGKPTATPEPQDRVPGEIVSQSPSGQVNWTTHKILSSGGGAPPDHGSPAQRRLLAERAALADAYRNLAEMIHGVHVSSETTVQDFVTQSDVIRTSVQGLVKGAVVSHKRLLSDGSVEVDVEIPLYGQDSLMQTMADQVLHKQPGSPGPSTWLPTYRVAFAGDPAPVQLAAAESSGLIIDVHGLGLEPAMSPAILSADRRELYLGTVPVAPDTIINQGMVEYMASMDLARKSPRVGPHPLVVKAQAVSGRLKADVVLDADTAAQVLGADDASHFLARAAVVLVV